MYRLPTTRLEENFSRYRNLGKANFAGRRERQNERPVRLVRYKTTESLVQAPPIHLFQVFCSRCYNVIALMVHASITRWGLPVPANIVRELWIGTNGPLEANSTGWTAVNKTRCEPSSAHYASQTVQSLVTSYMIPWRAKAATAVKPLSRSLLFTVFSLRTIKLLSDAKVQNR